jgi:signal transduction histidine kinase/CHASE3 domain sensor protein
MRSWLHHICKGIYKRQSNRYDQQRSIGQIGAVLLAIPAAFLALVLLGVSDVRRQELRIQAKILLVEEQMKLSEQVLRYVVDQETGVRGYLVTYDPQFLEPYVAAKQRLNPALQRLRATDTTNQALFNRLEVQIQQRYRRLDQLLSMAARHQGRQRSTLTGQRTGATALSAAELAEARQVMQAGKRATDAIRLTISDFQQQQYQFLNRQQTKLQNWKQFLDLFQIIGAILSVMTYVGITYLFRVLERRMVLRDQERHRAQNLLKVVTQNIVDGVVLLNVDGKIEGLNPAAEKILGDSSQALVGRTLAGIFAPQTLFSTVPSVVEPSLKPVQSPNQGSKLLESTPVQAADMIGSIRWAETRAQTGQIEKLQVQQPAGQIIPIEVSVSHTRLRESTQPTITLMVIIRDVSERMQLTHALADHAAQLDYLNGQLTTQNILLESKNQSLAAFIKASAHDLKTPIRGMASLLQWLEADLSTIDTESQTKLTLMQQQVIRMQAIADGLLCYAGLDTLVQKFKIVDTLALVHQIHQQLSIPETFTVQVHEPMPTLYTAPFAIKLVLEQLIQNAYYHHDREQGKIAVMATVREHDIEFVVRDDGPGIAPAYRTQALEMFQILDPNPSTSGRAGVGLALVHKTLQLMGGTLELRTVSEEDTNTPRGLAVHFTWPIVPVNVAA